MGNLTALCAINSTIDASCDCLTSGGGPQMKTDISGPGVRISFYLQALFLACLSERSGSVEKMTEAVYTNIAMNVAMAVTASILGFKAEPEISLQDGIVVYYLLALSWISLFFSLPSYTCRYENVKTLKFIFLLHSFILCAFFFAITNTAEHFGQTVPCNPHATVVIIRPFRAIPSGVDVSRIGVAVCFFSYLVYVIFDYSIDANPEVPWFKKFREAWKSDPTQHDAALGEAGTGTATVPSWIKRIGWLKESDDLSSSLIIKLIVIFTLWVFVLVNLELTIAANNYSGGDGTGPDSWQFGQILPMFLVILPLVNLIMAFSKYKFQPRKYNKRTYGHTDGTRSSCSCGRGPGDSPFDVPLLPPRIPEHSIPSAHSELSVYPIDSLQK